VDGKRIGVLLVPLIVVAVAVLLLARAGDGPPPKPAGGPEPAGGSGSNAAREPGSGSGPPPIEDAAAVAERREPDGSVAAASPAPAAHDGPAVTVLRPDGFTPATGARVELLDLSALARDEVDAIEGFGEALFAQRGVVLETGAGGTARLPEFERLAWIHASADGAWGRLELQRDRAEDPRVVLREEAAIDVRVRDDSGAAVAGIPVVAGRQSAGHHGPAQVELFRARTDGEGRVTVPHAGWLVSQVHDVGWLPSSAFLFLSVDAVIGEPPQVKLDPKDLPETAEMTVPPTGTVVVRAVRGGGEPFGGEGLLMLELVQEESSGTTFRWRFERGTSLAVRRLAAGMARFRFVEVGPRLSIRLNTLGFRAIREGFDGPSSPGETVEHRIVVGDPVPTLSLVLLDEERRPLRNREVATLPLERSARSTYRTRTALRARAETDGEGRLVDFELTGSPPDDGYLRRRFAVLFEDEARAGQPEYEGRIDLPVGAWEGRIHGGELVLEQVPLLIAGRVKDAAGQPVEGAVVNVGSRRRFLSHTPPDGSFVIHARTEEEPLRVRASKRGMARGETVEVVPGARGVELVLRPATRVEGRVLLGEGVLPARVRILVESPGQSARTRIDEGGAFSFTASPGPATLRFLLVGRDEPVKILTDVEVVEGTTTDVGTVDLRDRAFAVEVTARTPAGEAVPHATVLVRAPTDLEYRSAGATDPFGRCSVAVPSLPVEIAVAADGRRLVRRRVDTSEVTLVLEPGFPVIVETGELPPLESGYRLIHHVRSGSADAGTVDRVLDRDARDDGTVLYRVGEPGPYESAWELYRSGRFRANGRTVYGQSRIVGEIVPVVVPDDGSTVTLDHPLDPAALERAQAELAALERIR